MEQTRSIGGTRPRVIRSANPIIDTLKDCRSKDLGWEDAFVKLHNAGLVRPADKPYIRRFFLALSSYSRRYGT